MHVIVRKIHGLACVLAILLGTMAPVHAQSDQSPLQLRNAMGTVLVSGLVGGVLGLSTLSFYSRPQDNIRNIFFGAGAGMLLAAIVMTADVAQAPTPNVKVDPQHERNFRWAPVVAPNAAGVAMSLKF